MSNENASTNEILRRGLLAISADFVLETIDGLNLKGNAKISAVVGMPLRSLQQKRDVTNFAVSAPIVAVRAILELIALEPLEKVIEALGEHADSPSYEQLSAGVDSVMQSGVSTDQVIAVMAFAIGEKFPAAVHCRRLLDERPSFHLPELPEHYVAPSLVVPKEIDNEIREKRRRRREEEKSKRSSESSRTTRAPKPRRIAKVVVDETVVDPAKLDDVTLVLRRRMFFTPAELNVFDPEHPLVGWVVLADVPFDATDPAIPEQRSKHRPALVVAASEGALLVLGIYSNQASSRNLFQPWRKMGLAHVSYIATERTVVALAPKDAEKIGQLSDDEWNSLF